MKAINAGTVVLARDCFLAGNVVVVAHGGGIASANDHLSKVSVSEGESVAQRRYTVDGPFARRFQSGAVWREAPWQRSCWFTRRGSEGGAGSR